jgi:PAS domain S-box-containing protein
MWCSRGLEMKYEDMSREDLIQEISRLKAHASGSDAQLAGHEATLLQMMCDNVPDMIWAKDVDKKYLFANKAICEQLLNARDTEEPLGKDDLFFAERERVSHPGNPEWHTFGEICLDSDAIVLNSREAGRFDEYGNVHGEFLYLDVHKAPFWDDAGKLIGTVGSARNVTKDRKTEESLRRSEDRFKTIFHNTDISIWEEDFSQLKLAVEALKEQGVADMRAYLREHPEFLTQMVRTIKVLDVNHATLALYGASSKEELLGNLERVLLPETGSMLQEFIIAVAEGQPRFEHETVNQTLDGRVLNILIRLFLPKDAEEYHNLLLCIIDITARKQLEAERRRSQKLESLGVLAGGLAHDFNNLLMGITGSISLARMHLELCDPDLASKSVASLQSAEKACERARSLTHQLLTFASGGTPIKKTLSVRDLLTSAVNFSLSGSKVRCQYDIPDDIWNIEADENQFTQVISNLVLNGIEAMPGGGVLNVQARNRKLEDREIAALPARQVVEITIQDHGIGIPEEHIHRVFDPYFTAKKGGRGLGLAIVYSVVLKHGGHIKLDSEIGMGTLVTIFLPATEAEPQRAECLLEEPGMGSGSVLVMDDEEIVRTVATAMLEFLGYSVETARDGVEMLARYKAAWERGAAFDLVIMDLTIPGGMGGAEGIKALLAFDPQAKAIVSSGYSNNPVMANYQAYGFAGVVPKPYQIDDLRRALLSVLVKTRE